MKCINDIFDCIVSCGSNTIEDEATFQIYNKESITVKFNGVQWYAI